MIREATAMDIDRVIDMAERFARESEYKVETTWNRLAIANTVSALIANPNAVVLLAEVSREGGGTMHLTTVGMLAITLYPHPFSGETAASELAWWVDPEARGGGAGLRLLHAGEVWAKHRGARLIQMIAPNEGVGRLYAKLGYTALETWYQRRL